MEAKKKVSNIDGRDIITPAVEGSRAGLEADEAEKTISNVTSTKV